MPPAMTRPLRFPSRAPTLGIVLAIAGGLLALAATRPAPVAQQPTPVPTVTSTPTGPFILVPEQVNVRSGPGTNYDLIGVLISGQTAPAVGRSPGGEWIQIVYPGVPGNVAWVYAPLVRLQGQGVLPVVEPPPTPTPQVTATIDPTLAAQFNLPLQEPTRLPTYTPVAPEPVPTFTPAPPAQTAAFPPALAILGLLALGAFGLVISFLRGT